MTAKEENGIAELLGTATPEEQVERIQRLRAPAAVITILYDGRSDEVIFSITGGPIAFDKLRGVLGRVAEWSIAAQTEAAQKGQPATSAPPVSPAYTIPGKSVAHD